MGRALARVLHPMNDLLWAIVAVVTGVLLAIYVAGWIAYWRRWG